MTMGSELRRYIKLYCGSLRAFAIDLGWHESTIRHWCNDEHTIPLKKLAIIGEYFAEFSGEPPHFFVMRLTMAHPTVIEVVKVWQRNRA
tara:strand:- start:109 stop:375 length:267 start_codon:yes stop_codon:yes gene_type:complete